MKSKTALVTITIIAAVGILFSGYLSYQELFAESCSTSFVRCGSWTLADLPACVYGLVMYIVVFIVALLGQKKAGTQETQTSTQQ
jgi:ABC-type phosphate transport system permease subunit